MRDERSWYDVDADVAPPPPLAFGIALDDDALSEVTVDDVSECDALNDVADCVSRRRSASRNTNNDESARATSHIFDNESVSLYRGRLPAEMCCGSVEVEGGASDENAPPLGAALAAIGDDVVLLAAAPGIVPVCRDDAIRRCCSRTTRKLRANMAYGRRDHFAQLRSTALTRARTKRSERHNV